MTMRLSFHPKFGLLSGETNMDPLTAAGLVVALIVAVVVGYYLMKPEKN
jgi:hypothetical protein